MALTLEQIIAASQKASPKVVKYRVEEFDLDLYLTPITGTARDKLEVKFAGEAKERVGWRSLLITCSLADETGKRLDQDGLKAGEVGRWPASIIGPLADKCMAISGLSESEAEEMEKN